MARSIISIVLIFFLKIITIESANILGIFHYPSYSHHLIYQKVVKDLSERGHKLTILTVYPINDHYPNVTEIVMGGAEGDSFNFVEAKEKNFSSLRQLFIIVSSLIARTHGQLTHPDVQRLIKETQHFDLLLLEFLFRTPFVYFGEHFNCPIVAMGTMDVTTHVHELIGNYVNPTIHTDILVPYEDGKMSMLQRLDSVVTYFVSLAFTKIVETSLRSILGFYFPNANRTFDEMDRIEFLLVNSNPIMNGNRPVTSNTILLGNMHIEPPKALPEKLQNLFDSSENGVIYVSFGSNVRAEEFSEEKIQMFLNVFEKLKYDVLWKYNGHFNNSSYIHTSKWFPQADILAHKKVKLFITHCGQHSVEEAIDRGVPMIAIPFAVDQFKNAFKIRSEQIGVLLDFDDLSEENLQNAIQEALKPKYVRNIQRLRDLINDVPMKSREKAVWWIEYALRNKDMNRLKYSGTRVPFHQRYLLDFIFIASLTLYVLRKVYKLAVETCGVRGFKRKCE